MTDFEDPTALGRCVHSDCVAYRVGGTPFCVGHLREQEQKSAGYVEPDVEVRATRAGDEAMGLYVGPDPDTNGFPARSEVKPDPATMEPVWDGSNWVLRPKSSAPDMNAVRALVRELMFELGIREAE